jgi:hypothetical protein
MEQTIHTAKINKYPILCDILYHPFNDFTIVDGR